MNMHNGLCLKLIIFNYFGFSYATQLHLKVQINLSKHHQNCKFDKFIMIQLKLYNSSFKKAHPMQKLK